MFVFVVVVVGDTAACLLRDHFPAQGNVKCSGIEPVASYMQRCTQSFEFILRLHMNFLD